MIRATLADAKDPTQSNIAATANVSPDDARFVQLVNQATRELVQTGEMFYGLHQRVQFCVTEGCLVLPRQIATIEAAALCSVPIPIQNHWYEYLPSGPGVLGDGSCGSYSGCGRPRVVNRGQTCAFADLAGDNKKIKVYADVAEDADAKILLQGYDENGNWIRTQVSGAWVDGEYVSISTTPATSTKFFTTLVAVQKPVTNGTVRLYAYDTDLLTQTALAVYEPDETRPNYQKVLIPGITDGPGCCGDGTTTAQVTIEAKLEFIPVSNDTDWLLIGNLPALESQVKSILHRRNNLPQEAMVANAQALKLLRDELRHYLGHGAVTPMRMQPRNLGGAGVANMQ